MTGAGISYREMQRVRVKCSECGEEMAMGFLEVHQHTQHMKAEGVRRHWSTTAPGGEPQTYKMAFPTARGGEELYYRGMLGTGVDADGDEGKLPPL